MVSVTNAELFPVDSVSLYHYFQLECDSVEDFGAEISKVKANSVKQFVFIVGGVERHATLRDIWGWLERMAAANGIKAD